jgi:hypothetical protein
MQTNVKVLEVGAEGGSITLFGNEIGGNWYFSRKVIDQTPELLDEDWIVQHTKCVATFEAALRLIEQYPWHDLNPEVVHPDFRQKVFATVMERAQTARGGEPRRLSEWQRICGELAR